MATTQPKSKGKKGKGRVWLAVGLVAVVVLGYLWYRSRSSSALLAASPSGANAGSGAGDQGGSAGGISGSPLDSSGQDLSGLLGALQGENQSLLDAFVANQGRIAVPVGGVAAAANQTPAVTAVGTGPNDLFQPPAVSAPEGSGLAMIQQEEGYGSAPVSTNAQVQAAAAAGQSYLETLSPNLGFTAPTPTPSAPSKPPVSSASGASAVKSGAAKKNYQAAARAA